VDTGREGHRKQDGPIQSTILEKWLEIVKNGIGRVIAATGVDGLRQAAEEENKKNVFVSFDNTLGDYRKRAISRSY